MSGPAGGVTGALWVAVQAGFPNLLTVDVGGTSTDVALIMNGQPRLRRETTVGDVTVRASSVDIRTVGAGGGSIAHVPELTSALRVGPQSAGAEPGPCGLRQGWRGTDRHRRERRARLPAGDAAARRRHARSTASSRTQAVEKIGKALGKSRRGRGARHLRHRQREHGRRAAARVGRAGPRSARLRADRVRRRRARCTRMRCRACSAPGRRSSRRARACCARSATRRRRCATSRRAPSSASSPRRRRRRSRSILRAARRRTPRRRSSARRSPAADMELRLPGRRALSRPGAAAHDRRRPRSASSKRGLKAISRALRRRAHAALHLRAAARARVRGAARRRAGHAASAIKRHRDRAAAAATAKAAVGRPAGVYMDGTDRCGHGLRPRAAQGRQPASPARRS